MENKKIPDLIYWPSNYREGLNQYKIPELEKLIKDTMTKEWICDRRTYIEHLKLWKKIPSNEKNAQKMIKENKKIISNYLDWLILEEKLKIKCNYLKIDYIHPEPFPVKYTTNNDRQLTFYINYYWTTKEDTNYYDSWKNWYYYDCKRIEYLKKIIQKEMDNQIKLMIQERFETLPFDVKNSILEKYESIQKEIKEKLKPKPKPNYSKFGLSSGLSNGKNEMRYAPNGMCIERKENQSELDWMECVADFKQALRDF